MFNAQKLLGGLLSGGAGTSRLLGTRGSMGLGVLGVALAAAEHFMDKAQTQTAGKAGPDLPAPQPGTGRVPPPPPRGSPSSPPPPPPGAITAAKDDPEQAQDEALLLIRAMIAAAHADGQMDVEERQAILGKLESLNLSPEERTFILQEFDAPKTLEDIVRAVSSEELKTEVYVVSCLAVTIDTAAEQDYLEALGERLGLSPESRASIHEQLEISIHIH